MSEALAEFIEKAEDSPDYYDALDYTLWVRGRPLSGTEADAEAYVFDLAEASVNVAHGGRVLEVAQDDKLLFADVDHRGPEHGIDGWVGDREEQTPRMVITDVALQSGVVEG